jgi:hypothetical protein
MAAPPAATIIAGAVLRDTGAQVLGGIVTAVGVGGMAFIWKAIQRSNRAEVEAIVRAAIQDEMAHVIERIAYLERNHRPDSP